jgi:RNA polymerase sigma-70 factor (ECF subfamily)
MASIKQDTAQLVPHLFRTEFRKITTYLCCQYGLEYLGEAEDIASESFLAALETWPYKGIPPNPAAWLYRVAKNKAINRLEQKASRRKIEAQLPAADGEDISYAEEEGDQLRMLFAICHPALSKETQVTMALRILGGFGLDEISSALLIGKETIQKRLYRGRETLKERGIVLEMPTGAALQERLEMVLLTIYLMFTEGYYSETKEELIREDLCFEAMRLAYLLTELPQTNSPKVRALLALFCFQASRFAARRNKNGEWLLYDQQDASLWDQQLIAKGVEWLHKASVGEELSFYHLEAAIAYWYSRPEDSPEKWEAIVGLYEQLIVLKPSPVVALNRIFAVYKLRGAKEAINLADRLALTDNPYYYMLVGELHSELDKPYALECFRKAHQLVHTDADRRFVEKRLQEMGG